MKKKVSFKNLKNLSSESSEIEPIKLSIKDIDKKNIFSNKAETIAKIMIEKIIINVFAQIKRKDLDSLLSTYCSNFVFKEINSLLSNYYPCYEKEDYFLSDAIFLNNYLRGEFHTDECIITQPTPGAIDRWKIHRTKIIDYTNRNKNQISEVDETQSVIYDKQSKKLIKFQKLSKLAKKIKEDREKEREAEKEKEEEKRKEEEEKKRIQKLGLRIMDSFPSYPLSDELFKLDINLTKEQEKQIEEYRAELIVKDELKKQEKENKAKIEKMKMRAQLKSIQNENEEKKNQNKFRGKSIGVTSNGEIIFIQNININNLKSEFLEINTRAKNYSKISSLNLNKNVNALVQKGLSLYNKNKDKVPEIEKNIVDDPNLDFFRINNKERMNQQIITGGSPFKNFIPEIGVNLKEKGSIKSGGTDFLHKYKKISLEQFEKTLEMFRRSNLANNEIIEIKYDNSQNKSDKKENINNNNKSNLLKSSLNNNNSSINNNILNNYNYNFINQKSLIKSSSLPELNILNSRSNLETSNIFNSINNNLNININNDSNIKNPFNYTNYNNSNSNFFNSTKYNNMNNFIKTSSSFKNLFYKDDNPYKEENIIPNYTTKQFFKKFNPKKNASNIYKIENDALTKIQDFNTDILKNNNWGSVPNSQGRNYSKGKPFIHKKNVFTKTLNNIFRVRSNVNEVYFRKMRVFDKISLRSQSTENKTGIQKIVFDKK